MSFLGFIPDGLLFDALELSPMSKLDEWIVKDFGVPFITSSDAHYLNDIGRVSTVFSMNAVTVEELRKALKGQDGRKVTI